MNLTPTNPTWVVMPILGARQYTITAIADCLAQSVPVKILLINQGVDDDFRDELERIAEEYEDRILLWSHQPPLPSLSATWNRALDFVWEVGGTEALVVNNDVRLHQDTVLWLQKVCYIARALFVSGVGVLPDQFDSQLHLGHTHFWDVHSEQEAHAGRLLQKGGPDFSCFLISQSCHLAFRFDEGFIPAFCEDCSYHRELMLAGHGADIFSVNLPYLHYASGTLKSVDAEKKAAIERTIAAGSRQHYLAAWGGPVNQELYTIKGDPRSACGGVTNPELQRLAASGVSVPDAIRDGVVGSAIPDSTASS